MATQNSLNKTSDGFTSTGGLANTAGIVAINSTTSACGISTDASATTVSLATGGAVKTVTLGSTNTTSSTAIKSGTGNVAINSGLTLDSTGRWTSSVQPMFLVGENASPANVTGDLTVYTVPFDTEVYDIGSNFASNTFTAPITGKYILSSTITVITSAIYTISNIFITTTARSYIAPLGGFSLNESYGLQSTVIADMTAGDTAYIRIQVGNAAKTIQIQGNTGAGAYATSFCGMLIS